MEIFIRGLLIKVLRHQFGLIEAIKIFGNGKPADFCNFNGNNLLVSVIKLLKLIPIDCSLNALSKIF
jgi:hypothetical protein